MNAIIKSSFWTDERLEESSPETKLAILWLITNPARDLCGFVKASNKRFAFETGLPPATLDGACKALPSSINTLPGGVYFVVNFVRHQFGKGGQLSLKNKVLVAAVRHAEALPSPMRKAFFAAYPELAHPSPKQDQEMIPHPSPIHGGCHGVREREGEGEESEGECEGGKALTIPDVVALYPRRESQREAVEILTKQVRAGAVDLEVVAAGTRAIAAVIARLPSGHLNAFVPAASKFFLHQRWKDDPQTWMRNANTSRRRGGAGAVHDELNLGGRRPASTVEI